MKNLLILTVCFALFCTCNNDKKLVNNESWYFDYVQMFNKSINDNLGDISKDNLDGNTEIYDPQSLIGSWQHYNDVYLYFLGDQIFFADGIFLSTISIGYYEKRSKQDIACIGKWKKEADRILIKIESAIFGIGKPKQKSRFDDGQYKVEYDSYDFIDFNRGFELMGLYNEVEKKIYGTFVFADGKFSYNYKNENDFLDNSLPTTIMEKWPRKSLSGQYEKLMSILPSELAANNKERLEAILKYLDYDIYFN